MLRKFLKALATRRRRRMPCARKPLFHHRFRPSFELLEDRWVPAGIIITETDGSTNVAENGATDTYMVRLQDPPGVTETVTISISTDGQTTVSPDALTFDITNFNMDQTVTVAAVDDNLQESTPHDSTITNAASSDDPQSEYNGISETVIAHVTDNDNAAPVANDDGPYSVAEDQVLQVPVGDGPPCDQNDGLLCNDTDANGDPLTVLIVRDPDHGALQAEDDGSFVYTPDPDYFGPDSFTYRAFDGYDLSNTATVTINVTPVNDPPTASADSKTTDEDTVLSFPANELVANDSPGPANENGQSLRVTTVTALPDTHGTVRGSSGNVIYQPDANYNGPARFQYTVCDDGSPNQCSTGIVHVTINPVNDPPVAVAEGFRLDEDTTLLVAAPGILANDRDPDGDRLSAILIRTPQHGELLFREDGSFRYRPDPDFVGTDDFGYRASDGTAESEGVRVMLIVANVNERPDAVFDRIETAEDTAVTANVLANDRDQDGDTLTISRVTQPANGTVVVNSNRTITYRPDANFNGVEFFDYTVSDGHGGSDTGTVKVSVTPVQDRPNAVFDRAATPEDVAVAIDVLANDVDVDGDSLRVIGVTQPANGTTVINSDNTVTYRPNRDFVGVDFFNYKITDDNGGMDTATVKVTVTAANDPPDAIDDSATTNEDTPIVIRVLDNDRDPDGDRLTVTGVTQPANGRTEINAGMTITYTPNRDFIGVDVFRYSISDGNGESDTANVTVTVKEGPPVSFGDFDEPTDAVGAGNVQPGSNTAETILVDSNPNASPAVLVVQPLTQQVVCQLANTGQFRGWMDLRDRTFFADWEGNGTTEIVQFNLPEPGQIPSGGFYRVLSPCSGVVLEEVKYEDIVAGFAGNFQNYRQAFLSLVNADDRVFVGHFTQQKYLEALFFNRTNQNRGTEALRTLNLVTGQITFTSLHDGEIFSGWLDDSDEYRVADTNNDGYQDFVAFNRVVNPEAFRQTSTRFVGMFSIRALPGAPESQFHRFYRFFNWNSVTVSGHSVFEGFDEIGDRVPSGFVMSNGERVQIMLLINSSSQEGLAYALLDPRPSEPRPDSFSIPSAVAHGAATAGFFDPDDRVVMADFDGDGNDDVQSFSVPGRVCVFHAFSGQVMGCMG